MKWRKGVAKTSVLLFAIAISSDAAQSVLPPATPSPVEPNVCFVPSGASFRFRPAPAGTGLPDSVDRLGTRCFRQRLPRKDWGG
jgi:hypothetical protein